MLPSSFSLCARSVSAECNLQGHRRESGESSALEPPDAPRRPRHPRSNLGLQYSAGCKAMHSSPNFCSRPWLEGSKATALR